MALTRPASKYSGLAVSGLRLGVAEAACVVDRLDGRVHQVVVLESGERFLEHRGVIGVGELHCPEQFGPGQFANLVDNQDSPRPGELIQEVMRGDVLRRLVPEVGVTGVLVHEPVDVDDPRPERRVDERRVEQDLELGQRLGGDHGDGQGAAVGSVVERLVHDRTAYGARAVGLAVAVGQREPDARRADTLPAQVGEVAALRLARRLAADEHAADPGEAAEPHEAAGREEPAA